MYTTIEKVYIIYYNYCDYWMDYARRYNLVEAMKVFNWLSENFKTKISEAKIGDGYYIFDEKTLEINELNGCECNEHTD